MSTIPKLPSLKQSGGGTPRSRPTPRGNAGKAAPHHGQLVPISPRTDTVFVSSTRTRYTLTPRATVDSGEVKRLTPRDMQHISHYIAANKKLNHSHRAGKVTEFIPDAAFVRLPNSCDLALGLSVAPVHAKESALDVPLRFQPPDHFHCPKLVDTPTGTTLSSRIVMLLKGTSSVPQHWVGESEGLERDVAHTNIMRDLEMRVLVSRRSQNARLEAIAQFSIGALYYNAGAIEKAVKNFVLASSLFEQTGDASATALCHNVAGVCYYKLGSYKLALIHHKKQEELSGSYGRCVAQTNMGVCYGAVGEPRYAEQAFTDAYANAVDSKDPMLETIAMGNFGLANMRVGDMKQAQGHLEQCLEHCSMAGDKVGAAVCLLLLGEVYTQVNDSQHAQFYYEHSFRVAEEAGCRDVAEIARVSIGVARGSQAVKENFVSTARKMGAQFGVKDVVLCLPASQEGVADP